MKPPSESPDFDDTISQPPSYFVMTDDGGYRVLPLDGTETSNGSRGGGGAGSASQADTDGGLPASGGRGPGPHLGFLDIDTSNGGLPPCSSTLYAIVRDFHADGIDFEGKVTGAETGLVAEQLGTDRKPVFVPTGATVTVSGPQSFNRWYRDVQGVNAPFVLEMQFGKADSDAADSGTLNFYANEFFPLDGGGFGEEGFPHNYHFTTEIHTQFIYRGGERFGITGDDDVWIFVNGWLVADLGGTHQSETAEIDMDSIAGRVGIQVGHIYPFEMFHAERHTISSVFRADTNVQFVDCGALFPGDTQ